jgi:uncharacterized protein YcaQ
MPPSLDELRRFALGRSLFPPTTLERAIQKLGFIQADPIRAPARAQDLTLFQRVKGYRAGDLERRYEKLAVEEDFFVNYGFLARAVHVLMHPRSGFGRDTRARAKQAEAILAFVRERGAVHPREVERHLGFGTQENYWGGLSNTTTRLLDSLHYRGLLRVARRDAGIRVYAAVDAGRIALGDGTPGGIDALIDLAVQKYAPLPAATLAKLCIMLRHAAPQWRDERKDGLVRAKQRLASARVDGAEWFWPSDEALDRRALRGVNDGRVRLLSPFDPVVWDRKRFELFWGWAYRFEAYTPKPKRKLGYYALPLLWGDHVVGWANLSFAEQRLSATFGYVAGKPPRDPAFRRALEEELARLEAFMQPRRPVR